jgi:hypothetical protein
LIDVRPRVLLCRAQDRGDVRVGKTLVLPQKKRRALTRDSARITAEGAGEPPRLLERLRMAVRVVERARLVQGSVLRTRRDRKRFSAWRWAMR